MSQRHFLHVFLFSSSSLFGFPWIAPIKTEVCLRILWRHAHKFISSITTFTSIRTMKLPLVLVCSAVSGGLSLAPYGALISKKTSTTLPTKDGAIVPVSALKTVLHESLNLLPDSNPARFFSPSSRAILPLFLSLLEEIRTKTTSWARC